MGILTDPEPDMLAVPRINDGAIDMQELIRRLAEQVVNAIMDSEADQLCSGGAPTAATGTGTAGSRRARGPQPARAQAQERELLPGGCDRALPEGRPSARGSGHRDMPHRKR